MDPSSSSSREHSDILKITDRWAESLHDSFIYEPYVYMYALWFIHINRVFLNNKRTIPCTADDHWTHKSEASPWPTEGAVLPASVHPGARAHWCSASSRVVGTSCPTFNKHLEWHGQSILGRMSVPFCSLQFNCRFSYHCGCLLFVFFLHSHGELVLICIFNQH